jgi:general secretion pathway protein J
MPNWNRGFARVQRTELASRGLERLVADIAAAEFMPMHSGAQGPLFEGGELSVTFVRSALGPNARPGLEIVRIAETADERGLAVVRMRAPFAPLAPDGGVQQTLFSDPVVLMRAPYRVMFSYAGADRAWRANWGNESQLPSAVRVTIRDATTGRSLAMSTATRIHINASAGCVRAKNTLDCVTPKAEGPGKADGPKRQP